jgi:hypothetical protein
VLDRRAESPRTSPDGPAEATKLAGAFDRAVWDRNASDAILARLNGVLLSKWTNIT